MTNRDTISKISETDLARLSAVAASVACDVSHVRRAEASNEFATIHFDPHRSRSHEGFSLLVSAEPRALQHVDWESLVVEMQDTQRKIVASFRLDRHGRAVVPALALGEYRVLLRVEDHGGRVFAICALGTDRLITGHGDGSLRIWDTVR